MDETMNAIIATLKSSPFKFVFITTKGSKISSTLQGKALETIIPGCKTSLQSLLGTSNLNISHQEATNVLAGRALTRAKLLLGPSEKYQNLFGVACTTQRCFGEENQSTNRAFISTWSSSKLVSTKIEYSNRSDHDEDDLLTRALLSNISRACNVSRGELNLALDSTANEKQETHEINYLDAAQRLIDKHTTYFKISKEGDLVQSNDPELKSQLIVSGSFNPVHLGHVKLLDASMRTLQATHGAYELSAFNADKPPLTIDVILERAAQFAGLGDIYITNAPTFVMKAKFLHNATFAVGYDTAIRIVNSKYYNNSDAERDTALEGMQHNGCGFIVGGRTIDGKFHYIDSKDINIPAHLMKLFASIPENIFREDISSTELRQLGQIGYVPLEFHRIDVK
jgi:hypothetical protein